MFLSVVEELKSRPQNIGASQRHFNPVCIAVQLHEQPTQETILAGVFNFLRELTCTKTTVVRPAARHASVAEDRGAAGEADGASFLSAQGVPAQRVSAGRDFPRETCDTLKLTEAAGRYVVNEYTHGVCCML